MIREVSSLLRGVKGLTFAITREEGSEERLQVMVTSMLGEAPKGADDSIEQMRAVLAMPMVLRGTADEIDAVLPNLIERAAIARGEVAGQVDASIQAIEVAAKEAARVAKDKAAAKKPKVVAKATPSKPAPKPVVAKPPAAAAASTERKKPGPKPGWKGAAKAAEPSSGSVVERKKPGPKPGWKAAKQAAAALSGVSATAPTPEIPAEDFPQSLLFGKDNATTEAPVVEGVAPEAPAPAAEPGASEASTEVIEPGASSDSVKTGEGDAA